MMVVMVVVVVAMTGRLCFKTGSRHEADATPPPPPMPTLRRASMQYRVVIDSHPPMLYPRPSLFLVFLTSPSNNNNNNNNNNYPGNHSSP
jgi:hypothetical protein